MIKKALKMLKPTGGQDVCRTIAENERSVCSPWLWIAQKQARTDIWKKSTEWIWLSRPATFTNHKNDIIIKWNDFVEFIEILHFHQKWKHMSSLFLHKKNYLIVRESEKHMNPSGPKFWRSNQVEEWTEGKTVLHIEG